jgi:hypothetical protein
VGAAALAGYGRWPGNFGDYRLARQPRALRGQAGYYRMKQAGTTDETDGQLMRRLPALAGMPGAARPGREVDRGGTQL